MGTRVQEFKASNARKPPAVIAIVVGLVLNAVGIAYSAGLITQRIAAVEQRLDRIENFLSEIRKGELHGER